MARLGVNTGYCLGRPNRNFQSRRTSWDGFDHEACSTEIDRWRPP